MSKTDAARLAQTLGLSVEAVRKYEAIKAPIHQPAAFVIWLREHWKESRHAQISQAA